MWCVLVAEKSWRDLFVKMDKMSWNHMNMEKREMASFDDDLQVSLAQKYQVSFMYLKSFNWKQLLLNILYLLCFNQLQNLFDTGSRKLMNLIIRLIMGILFFTLPFLKYPYSCIRNHLTMIVTMNISFRTHKYWEISKFQNLFLIWIRF